MTEYFKAKQWAITGALEKISRRDATAQLQARGASVTSSVTTKTHFLVSVSFDPANARWLSNKETKARQYNIPIFNEAQLIAILAGEEPAAIEALSPVVEIEEIPSRDALEHFRDLVYGELTQTGWETICDLIDQIAPEDRPIVLDYLQGNLSDASTVEWVFSPHNYFWSVLQTLNPRTLPPRWLFEVLRGEDHPKLALVRVANLAGQKINATLINGLIRCTHLSHIKAVNLNDNPIPMKAWGDLLQSPLMRQPESLHLGKLKISADGAALMAHAPLQSTLTHLMLSKVELLRGAASAFFASPAWANLTFLQAHTIKSTEDVHAALAAATHIKKLTHLTWTDVNGQDASLAALLSARHLSGLRFLSLRRQQNSAVPEVALRAIAQATDMNSLEHLDIMTTYWSPIDHPGLPELLAAPHLASLKILFMSTDPQGLEALADATHLRALQHLELNNQFPGVDAWERLLTASHLDDLLELHITAALPPGFVGRLLSSDRMPRLASFALSRTHLDSDDIDALIKATHRTPLQNLHAYIHNDVSTRQLSAAVKADHLPEDFKRILNWELHQRKSNKK